MEEQFLLDTNILVLAVRDSPIWQKLKVDYSIDFNNTYISIVSKAELLSLAKQFKWGKAKMQEVANLLEELIVLPIDGQKIVDAYVELDLYSQKLGEGVQYPPDFTSRNMGKNDLWIAATAYLSNATLLSTDKDFNHLKDVFIK